MVPKRAWYVVVRMERLRNAFNLEILLTTKCEKNVRNLNTNDNKNKPIQPTKKLSEPKEIQGRAW